MNERIKELAEQAELYHLLPNGKLYPRAMSAESCDKAYAKFAELIVRECVDQCSQEWYELNNSSKEELDDRGIAIRVGQKNGVLKVQHRLKQHFGVE